MGWSTPKTDWYGNRNTFNVYTGDKFNAEDFNRLKNNLVYLRDLAVKLYPEFTINDIGADRTVSDYFYAEDINAIEENLTIINKNTLNIDYGTAPTYLPNGTTMDYKELNRMESAMLDLYDQLINQYNGRRKFEWNFGMKEGF